MLSGGNHPTGTLTFATATPTLTTTAFPNSAMVGSSTVLKDTAALIGGNHATGTITFTLWLGTTKLDTETRTVNGDGLYTTPTGYTLPNSATPGTYQWSVTYSGDSNNNPVTSIFGSEPVFVSGKATPTISTTQQPASATVGSSIADKVTVTGGNNPTGTVTFNLYNNPTASGTPLFTNTQTLSGGTATSAGYTTTATGTDYWVATYNGNTSNSSVTSPTSAEPVTIGKATPSIRTLQQPPTAVVGNSIADMVTVTGGFNPTGTVTFNLYNNPTGTGPALLHRHRDPLGRHGHFGQLHDHRRGHGLLGGHLQRQQQQQIGCQRQQRGTGERDQGHAVNRHLPATGQHHGRQFHRRQSDRQWRIQPHRHCHLQPLQQLQRHRPALYTVTETLSGGTATSGSYATTATGTVYWVATYNGNSNNNSVTSATSAEPVTIGKATPSITTCQQPASTTVGSSIADKVTVSGGYNPTGTVTFNLYNNPSGTGTPAFTDTETLSGGTATSASFTTTGTGTGYWVATYNGNSNNNSVTSVTSAEPVTVTKATPSISTTQQPASVTVGGTIADQVTVSGGYNPSGTVTFDLYNNPNGTGTPAFTDTETLVGGTATSASFTTTGTGTGYWVATYNGNSNNNSVTSVTSAEPVTVTPATPTISTTQQPATVTVGSSIADKVTVSGGYNPTGTVTFNLYANPSGTGTPAFTDTETLSGGTATSASFTTTGTGTGYWVATYNGNSNNNSVTSVTRAEPVTVTPATPSILTTQQPATVTVGGTIADQVIVYGGYNPTGTVTFNLYANPNGTGTPAFTDTETLVGGTATSASFTTTGTGTGYWVATYNGNSNNNSVTSVTSAEPVTVTPASPTVTTMASQTGGNVVGTSMLSDSATLAGGYNETGSIDFSVTTPNGVTAVFPPVTVSGNGTYSSPTLTATQVGTYTWHASYSGDSNNNDATDNGVDESSTTVAASPTLTTSASQTGGNVVGTSMLSDSATLAGGYNETGSIDFSVTAPDGSVTAFLPVAVSGGGTYSSPTLTAMQVGTYTWHASYSGDSNNNDATDNGVDETLTTVAATPSISTTQQPASVAVGGTIADQVTVSGGYNPTGTVTFNLYANPNGTGTPAFTDTETLVGGTATSASFTTTGTGTGYWVATYNGNSNNNSVTSVTSAEPVTVTAASPTLTTTASETLGGVVGSSVLSDTATLAGSYMGTGTITFSLTAPDGSITTYPAVTVSGDNTYSSPNVTATQVGTYTWHAAYSGDTNNNGATDNGTNESLTTVKATPGIVTIAMPTAAPENTFISDQVIVYGGDNPTGNVTFNLYNNPSGTGTSFYTVTMTLSGGTASSGTVELFDETGTFYWVVTYGGDSNNNSVTSGLASEPVTIGGAG